MRTKPLLPPVSVNGVPIPPERIAAEAQNHPAPKGKPGLAWNAAARALVLRELLLQEARTRGLSPTPTELAPRRWETEDEALIRQLLEAAIPPQPIDEAALRARYEADPGRFRSPALYEAAHILIPAAPDDAPARQAARARAEALAIVLAAKPDRFAALAAEHSACPSGAGGGLLGQIAAGDTVPEFEAALAAMEPGAITRAPVESRYGFHLIRLDARAEGRVLPFAAVRAELAAAQEKAGWVRASRAFAAMLLARAEVVGLSLPA